MTLNDIINQSSQIQIGDLADEINRQADHLDSLTNSVVIIANGSVVLTYDSPSKTYPVQTIPVTSGINNGYMAYLERSDQPGVMYALPYFEVNIASNAVLMSANIVASSGSLSVQTGIISTYTTPPATLTIHYYLIQQAISQQSS